MTQITHFSDGHLDFKSLDNSEEVIYKHFSNTEKSDILCILGDLCEIRNIELLEIKTFFKTVSENYEIVLYVLGNHEFYHSEYYSAKLSLKNFIKENGFNNIYILDNDVFEYGDYVFIGSTLWTDLGRANPIVMNSARIVMNDYRVMRYNDSKLSVQNTLDFHSHSLDFIQKFLEKYKDRSIIMLTHHTPSYESRDKRMCNSYADFYCSNLEHIVYDNPNILIWLHGHTHYKTTYYINDCLVQSNPKGYPEQFNDFKVKTIQLK